MEKKQYRIWDAYNLKMYIELLGKEEIEELKQYKNKEITELTGYNLMETTEIKDQNKQDVFEGDIVWIKKQKKIEEGYYVICYDAKQEKFKLVPPSLFYANAGNGGWTGWEMKRYECAVKGNIFENTELIKQKETAI